MDLTLIAGLVLLVLVANGAPVLLSRLLGHRPGAPVDFGLRLPDGQPLFGMDKTWRGLAAALLASLAAGWLLFDPLTGLLAGAGAMTGDLLSSFIKRRLKLAPGARATGLDQVPECLLPLLILQPRLALGWPTLLAALLVFVSLDMLLSRWLHRIAIRKHPH